MTNTNTNTNNDDDDDDDAGSKDTAAAAAAAAAAVAETKERDDAQQQQQEELPTVVPRTTAPPRRILRRRRRRGGVEQPAETTADRNIDPAVLQRVLAASHLPPAYQFEIEKTVQRIVQLRNTTTAATTTHIALQLPEGLLLYATVLADVLQQLVAVAVTPTTTTQQPQQPLQVSILGDVTYGACCVDDLTAASLGCQLLIHYGHSCLVPLQHTVIPVLYVFCEIQLNVPHLVDCFIATLLARQQQQQRSSRSSKTALDVHIYLLGTVQFRHCLVTAQELLVAAGYRHVTIPQCKPLSAGEVLGCTSPVLNAHSGSAVVCFVSDGRFHLESTMISNQHNHIDTYYRYDPYAKTMTVEAYEYDQMKEIRQSAIQHAAAAVAVGPTTATFGIILGTLGRQGNPAIVQRIQRVLSSAGVRHFVLLLSEITPAKLQLLKVDCWVQVACPRLSVDWGHCLSSSSTPVLSPYELFVCLEETVWRDSYPMDYYSASGGPWTNYYDTNKDRQLKREQPPQSSAGESTSPKDDEDDTV